MALILQWTIKNVIKKRPVRPMINFLPIDEVKKCFQDILKALDFVWGTKIRQEGAKTVRLKNFYRNTLAKQCLST